MKKSKSFLKSFLIVLTAVFAAALFISCPREPEPDLKKPVVTLKPLEEAPQTAVIISWVPSDEADYYYIERTMVRDEQTETRQFGIRAVPFEEATDDPYTYIDDTCESGTEYTYVVTVEASWSNGGLYPDHKYLKSDPEKITTAADPKVTLAYPKNVKVEPTTNKSNALTVSWDAVPDALEYEIYYCSSWEPNYNEKYEKVGTTSQTSYTMEHLANEAHYYFMIKAIKNDEYSLYSAKADGRVAEAENLTKDKAFVLENGVEENLYSNEDTMWFKCTPQKGMLSIDTSKKMSLTIFDASGNVVATGLPLFISGYEQKADSNLTYIQEDDLIKRNIKNDIPDFVAGSIYYLRIVSTNYCSFSICVE